MPAFAMLLFSCTEWMGGVLTHPHTHTPDYSPFNYILSRCRKSTYGCINQ